MWIRSQNGYELINTNRLSIEDDNIWGYVDGTSEYCVLGEYESDDRAKTVLDEIQKFIYNLENDKQQNFSNIGSQETLLVILPVYEMPQE